MQSVQCFLDSSNLYISAAAAFSVCYICDIYYSFSFVVASVSRTFYTSLVLYAVFFALLTYCSHQNLTVWQTSTHGLGMIHFELQGMEEG